MASTVASRAEACCTEDDTAGEATGVPSAGQGHPCYIVNRLDVCAGVHEEAACSCLLAITAPEPSSWVMQDAMNAAFTADSAGNSDKAKTLYRMGIAAADDALNLEVVSSGLGSQFSNASAMKTTMQKWRNAAEERYARACSHLPANQPCSHGCAQC